LQDKNFVYFRQIFKTKDSQMKKTLLLTSCILAGGYAMSQTSTELSAPAVKTFYAIDPEVQGPRQSHQVTIGDAPENTILWSEDFGNGLPSTWSNEGFDDLGAPNVNIRWEYRGPNTTPSNAVGSRGAYGSAAPLASATAANGFMVFDSDFLDNAGVQGNFGNGLAAAPHVARLTSPVINLSQNPFVTIELQQYYRRFAGPGGSQQVPATYLQFSTDGGTTWGSPVTLNAGISVNSATPNGQLVQLNASSFIGGSANARVRILFDGDYYVWMIDDIKIRELVDNALQFTAWRGAPSHDMLFRNLSGGNPKYGHMSLKQCRDVWFDANIYNFGRLSQTGVRLAIDVLDQTGAVVFTTTTADTTLASGDTASFNVLTTTVPWETCNMPVGEYRVVYRGISNSIPSTTGSFMPVDTFIVRITDSINALNFGDRIENTVGTNTNFGQDAVAFAARFDLTNDERGFGTWAWISRANSRPGALVNVYVYDTTGFDLVTGFPTSPRAFLTHTLTSADTANGFLRFSFTDANGVPVYLQNGGYYLVWEFFSNAGATPIFIANDGTFLQPGLSSIFYFTRPGETPRWYSGFTNSRSFVSPIIRMLTCPASAAATCMQLSVEEVTAQERIDLFPNPTDGILNLRFDTHNFKRYDIKLVNMNGQVVFNREMGAAAQSTETLDFTNMAAGLYMLHVVANDGKVNTYKVNIQ
jgi:hypothetical protein